MNFAAIDIGSNAIRLLIGTVIETEDTPFVKKISLTRVPIRLGADVFTKGRISERNKIRLAKALFGFKNLIEAFEVEHYRICATSAMRDAMNNKEVMAYVEGMSGLKIEVISGAEEAELIFSTFFSQKFDENKEYLYVDVGGGSTEVTLIQNNQPVRSKSFNLGTVRILNNKAKDDEWDALKKWLKKIRKGHKELKAIGTGGNINKIIKMTAPNREYEISYEQLAEFKEFIEGYTYEERMEKLGLKPDRADVIVPATHLYTMVMKEVGIKRMYVPRTGLADGVIYQLFNQHHAKVAI